MIKFLIEASYSIEGAKGVLKTGGGSSRKQATEKMITELGGKLEAFYYVSHCDAYVICELPDMASAAAIALTIKASGFGSIKTTVLLEVEEVDNAKNLAVHYPGPGN